MLASLVAPFRLMFRSPGLFLVPLVTAALSMTVIWLLLDPLFDVLINILFLENVPQNAFPVLPFTLFVAYAPPFVLLGIGVLVLLWAQAMNGIFLAAVARIKNGNRAGTSEALRVMQTRGVQAISISLLFALLALAAFTGGWLLLSSTASWGILGTLLVLAYILTLYLIYITLVFVIPIIGIQETTVTDALRASVSFSRKRLPSVFLFILLTAAVNAGILQLGALASDTLDGDSTPLLVFALFWAVAFAYQGLAFPLYYLEQGGSAEA